MRLRRFVFPSLVLAALLLTACSAALEGTDSEPVTITPSAADINAAAQGAASDLTTGSDWTTATPQEPSSSQPSEDAAVDPAVSVDQSQSGPAKEPQINRRVEVPDDLRVNWLIPWDGIRPIYNPEFTSAGDAPLEDDELIIGVAWDGEAKAYPISVLRSREMVNDELAGIPTLVTW